MRPQTYLFTTQGEKGNHWERSNKVDDSKYIVCTGAQGYGHGRDVQCLIGIG